MLAQRDQTPILQTWQSDLNYAVEAGIAPTIPLGVSDSALVALPSLSLLRHLSAQRTDMTVPIVLAGGGSGAWLTALLVDTESAATPVLGAETDDGARTPQERLSPEPVVVFSGADAATHMASSGILPKPPARLEPVTDRGLPAGVRDAVAPALQPAASMAWENMPFRILDSEGGATGLPAASRWIGWLAGVLTILMILGALIA